MSFNLIFENDFVQVRRSPMCVLDVAVVCVFGNGATYACISGDEWPESCVQYCHFAINVKHRKFMQAKYIFGHQDAVSPPEAELTSTDEAHTACVLDGVCDSLLGQATFCSWLVHGASGGAVTACSLIRQLLANERVVIGLLVDCGVPGSGPPFSVPVSVFRSRRDPYWNAFDGQLFSIWEQSGFTVSLKADCGAKHARAVDSQCMWQCLMWFEKKHGMSILPQNRPAKRARRF